jgi:hypothetical protein
MPKQNCAQCHGADGKASARARWISPTRAWARKQKPVEQYDFITFGKQGVEHPVVRDKLRPSEIWNLVFYVRSLSYSTTSLIPRSPRLDPVFGGKLCSLPRQEGLRQWSSHEGQYSRSHYQPTSNPSPASMTATDDDPLGSHRQRHQVGRYAKLLRHKVDKT